ncbi:peptide/nickel transport system substrate-binding protein [Streptomyces sp. 3211.6]|uniref:ABC transporter family substrate-binding protein n=1 Tax=unclassified Streptomyces TaxID=2593676 RepID=UPI000EB58CE4|nr:MULTISPECIES: ABC transporter family substrate-binding protein [unclassified Streptomyces]RKT06707.1 peptide/nickel transport system substrate-binding protein [Streptomyces sp. 3211.6]RPF45683.1 peptide/nickel transport system substrate-binding protein [Streptomyces sp. Ag109_G2-6]
MTQRTRRSLALLTSGVLALPLLAGCGAGDDDGGPAAAGPDIALTAREQVADGGVLRWAVDSLPETLNSFQADADATTSRIAGAVLPQLFTLDAKGRPVANPDYLEKAEVVQREPKQVVLYRLNQKAVWSDGREIGAPDFVAQWRALSGKDSAYWTARNAGYERIEKIERGKSDLEVKVTFVRPYADWRSLFSPLYPKQVMGTPEAFNEGARGALKVTAGPFSLGALDKKTGTAALTRNPRWWGRPAKLDTLVLTAVPRAGRPAALAEGKLDLAEIDRAGADRIALAHRDGGRTDGSHGPGASLTPAQATLSWALAHGADEAKAREEQERRQKNAEAVKKYADEQSALRGFEVRKSLEPSYTQLAMNGASGPLSDERVRRAIARALDRKELAEIVLKPLGLPAKPVGSHLALAGQPAYADNSDALGGRDTHAAQALLADAGWRKGGKLTEPDGAKAGPEGEGATDDSKTRAVAKPGPGDGTGDDGLYIVGQDDGRNGAVRRDRPDRRARAGRPGTPSAGPHVFQEGRVDFGEQLVDEGIAFAPGGLRAGLSPVLAPSSLAAQQEDALLTQAGAIEDGKRAAAAAAAAKAKAEAEADGEDAKEPAKEPARATPAPAPAKQTTPRTSGAMLAKDGKQLNLRFVMPAGPGSEALRAVGERISQTLRKIGINTQVTKVPDESFFKDHIASGQYDLALYSWPATAFPATDARPIFAKPEPAADGSLLVEQNYTRVGTDHIDQLFDQAAGELDEGKARDLMRKADARIWAEAGSIPLYQRPELVAAKPGLANAGAFGLGAPRFQDIGWKKPQAAKEAKQK